MSEPADAPTWLEQAEVELRVARHLLAAADLPPTPAAFHAHLAAEKALKAALIRSGVEPPKVHQLNRLLAELGDLHRRGFDPEDLDLVNPWAVAGRYPSAAVLLREEAVTIIEAAARIVEAARGLLDQA